MADPQLVVNGLIYSSVIILGSIGLSLVYDVANFPNFAHGDLMAVGAFGTLVVNQTLGANMAVALLAGILVGSLVAVGTHRVVFQPLDAGPLELLISSIGVALVYRAVLITSFGAGSHRYEAGGRQRIELFDALFEVAVTARHVAIVTLTVALVVGLHVMLQYTSMGRKMRATSANRSLARVSGIRTDEVIIVMWAVGGALAAAGGVFLGLDTIIRPRMGFSVLLVMFAAVILGGIGSVYGAMLGGFVIGMAHELTPMLPYVGTKYKAAVAFVIMITILLVRPSGIVGGRELA